MPTPRVIRFEISVGSVTLVFSDVAVGKLDCSEVDSACDPDRVVGSGSDEVDGIDESICLLDAVLMAAISRHVKSGPKSQVCYAGKRYQGRAKEQ